MHALQEFCGTLEQAALELFASRESARNALTIEVVKFTDAGVELAIKVALPRMAASLSLDARRPWQSRIQRTFVGMAKVRSHTHALVFGTCTHDLPQAEVRLGLLFQPFL